MGWTCPDAHAVQTRLRVAVRVTDSYLPGTQAGVSAAHRRSDVFVYARVWYSPLLHVPMVLHSRSDDALGALASYSLFVQMSIAAHARSDEREGAAFCHCVLLLQVRC